MFRIPQYLGRPDGLGNRIEEIIRLEIICENEGFKCNYVWRNKHVNRKYPIHLKAENVEISSLKDKENEILNIDVFQKVFTQEQFLINAIKIKPLFEIVFEGGVKPIGVHIRGGDRIGKDHPHFMKDSNELKSFIAKTAKYVNDERPKHIFICSDNIIYKNALMDLLDKRIKILEPICTPNIPEEYIDFFALTICSKLVMCSKFSSFVLTASIVGNIKVVAFNKDEETETRYRPLIEYKLNMEDIDTTKLVFENKEGPLKKLRQWFGL